jgi:3alpha(or 20beta)-hydroxysteroid dehydrogenase
MRVNGSVSTLRKGPVVGRLEGGVALVTGAAQGQGEAIARLFVAEGAYVILGDLQHEAGRTVADSLGSSACYVPLDVTSPSDWQEAVGFAQMTFGKLTILINNAGVHVNRLIEEMTLDEYQRVISVNQTGCWLGMKTVAPALREAGGGAIVNTSSIAGLVGLRGRSAYVASKFAIRGMTKTAALEFGPSRIRVNSVHPGAIDTAMMSDHAEEHFSRLPIARAGTPNDVANMMVFLASEDAAYCTGAEFTIDGGSLAG